jgi:hypothetical protein
MSSASKQRNHKTPKKSIAQFQQQKSLEKQATRPTLLPGVEGQLSTSDLRLLDTIETAAFDKVRSGYSGKFDKFNSNVHDKDGEKAASTLVEAEHFIERQDYRQALKLLNEVSFQRMKKKVIIK